MGQSKYEQIARQFLGIPYRHGGRDRKGLDCLGLVHLFYRELGIKVPDNDGQPYANDWYKKIRNVSSVASSKSESRLTYPQNRYNRWIWFIFEWGAQLPMRGS